MIGMVQRGIRQVLFLLAVVVTAANVWSGGISTRFAELRVGNLRPGRVYSGSRDVIGEKYLVDNKTDIPLDFVMTLRVPETSELQPGFEPIPDLSWITFQQSFFTVGPGQTGGTDFYISVPTGTEHLGKKYQAQMGVNSFGGSSFVQMGLMGRALLSVNIEDVPWTPTEIKNNQFTAQLKFSPPAQVGELPTSVGWVDFSEIFTEPFVVKNGGDYPMHCRIAVSAVKESFAMPPPGFVPAPKGLSVKVRTRRFVIPPHSEKQVSGAIRVAKSLWGGRGKYYVTLLAVSEKTPGKVEAYTRLFLKGAP